MKAPVKKIRPAKIEDDKLNIAVKLSHLKIHLLNISPMIYRRFKVRGDTHIAALHHIIQLIRGWDNDHLHCFKIWDLDYGIMKSGGMSFHDDPCKIFIVDFGFKVGDKFEFDYDFGDAWCHEIRVEKIEPLDSKHIHPVCLEGKRAGPLEDFGGTYYYDEALEERKDWIRSASPKIRKAILERKFSKIDIDDAPYWYLSHQS